MKEQKFTVGQTVKHRSNPDIPLLVERYLEGEEKWVQCCWILNGQTTRAAFLQETLTADKEEDSTA